MHLDLWLEQFMEPFVEYLYTNQSREIEGDTQVLEENHSQKYTQKFVHKSRRREKVEYTIFIACGIIVFHL